MKLIALMGKAGSGKDTIVHELIQQYPNEFNLVVSCTSRPPREGEKDGINYHFLTEEEFIKRIANEDMLEYVNFNGWLYGTSRSELSEDKINIAVLNPFGIRTIMETDIDMKVYYVRASDTERLLRQLRRETNPDTKEILRRFSTDEKDFENLSDIVYAVLDNEIEDDLQNNIDIIAEGHDELKLELDGIDLELKIENYRENTDKWCNVTLCLKSGDWLNYKIDRQQILNSYEIDEIASALEKVINLSYEFEDMHTLEFIEPDIVLKIYGAEMIEMEISLWDEYQGLTANSIVLTLLYKNIKKLYNYIQRVRGEL